MFDEWLEDIGVYLPVEIRNPVEHDYFTAHIDAFIDNQSKNNDYALLALHQLFMFTAYGLVFGHLHDHQDLAKSVFMLTPPKPEERTQLQNITSLFTFSLLPERTFFDALALIDCYTEIEMKPLKNLVNERNVLAHCNGSRSLDFTGSIEKYSLGFKILHSKVIHQTKSHLREVELIDFDATEDVQDDAFKAFMSEHYISEHMVGLMMNTQEATLLSEKAKMIVNRYLMQ